MLNLSLASLHSFSTCLSSYRSTLLRLLFWVDPVLDDQCYFKAVHRPGYAALHVVNSYAGGIDQLKRIGCV